MTDVEKVIKGLKCCSARNKECKFDQEPICPYVEDCKKEDYSALKKDALKLIEHFIYSDCDKITY